MSDDSNTKDRILAAARQEFYQKGLAGARMAAIGEAAGVNKAMLHYYFRTKQDLFEEVFISAFGQVIAPIPGILMGEGGLMDRISRLSAYYHDTLTQTPELPVFVMNALQAEGGGLLKRVLERAQIPLPQMLPVLMEKIRAELSEGPYREMDPREVFLNVVSMSVFPFMLKPFLMTLFSMEEADFRAFIDQRRETVPAFLRQALELPADHS
ncbi:MAG: TetR/AcrR family transcriptional regulator [Bacteroidetes bacterium]|nr:MAG: TetR/AcrR family transcriptional regulator [Bacteroidota bacterium]